MSTRCPSCGGEKIEGAAPGKKCGGGLRGTELPHPAAQNQRTIMHEPLTALKMTKVHAIGPDTTLDAAIQTLVRQDVDILEVVDEGRLLGLLSVRDVITRVGADYPSKMNQPVRDFMTKGGETL